MVYRKYKAIKQWGRYNTLLFKKILTARNLRDRHHFGVPPAVKALGVEIHDPNSKDFLKEDEPTAINHPAFRKPSIADHPLYKEQKALLFEGNKPFSDGIDQACALVGALKPRPFNETLLKDRMEWPADLEERVIDGIMAGERYDPTLEKLEKRHDPIIFWTIGQRFFGTPTQKRDAITMASFYRQVSLLSPRSSFARDSFQDHNCSLSALIDGGLFGTNNPVVFRHEPDLLVQRESPAQPLLSAAEVEATRSEKVPDIYPISPLIDLEDTHIYNADAYIPRPNQNLYIDTVFLTRPLNQKYPWTTEQLAANAIVFAFGSALAQASRLGQPVARPEKPILTKAVQLHRGKMDLVVFQLNNLDLNDENAPKNVVWLEKSLHLYKPTYHDENLKKPETVGVDTFKKMANMLLY